MSARSRILGFVLMFTAAFALAFAAPRAARGQTTWYVDDDAPGDPGPGDPSISDPLEDGSANHPFDAIQEGIDAAVDGDTVLVRDGTYTGVGNKNLDFAGRLITVRSEDGPDQCVIDCEGAGRGLYLHSGETIDAVFEGFTITHAFVEEGFEAAVWCSGSGLTPVDCVITENIASGIVSTHGDIVIRSCTITDNAGPQYVGAGVFCIHGDSLIVDSTIARNSVSVFGSVCHWDGNLILAGCTIADNATTDVGANTAGVTVDSTSATILHCTIINNRGGYWGAGVAAFGDELTICDSVITGNVGELWGGGIDFCGERGSVINSVIADNSAEAGGGIFVERGELTLVNCIIAANHATRSAGGGVRCGGGPLTVAGCTIVGNTSSRGGGMYGCGGGSTVVNTVLWDNWPNSIQHTAGADITFCNVAGGWSGMGNIDVDPLFVDPDGPDNDPNTWEDNDFRLAEGSPCIDAGCNCGVSPDFLDLDEDGDMDEYTPFDLDGEGRFFDDPATEDTGSGLPPIVDMGAYEFGGSDSPPCRGDLDGDRDVDWDDLTLLLDNYGTPDGATGADGDMDCDGDVELSDLAALLSVYGTICE